ncbi:TonB-dependent receptor [Novosphingobium sp.]|uniref:TonB-dependent receptor n=1 Tax=Novosphingobium sp. TaxID=1874826 RepID=UPI0038BBD91A
MAKSIRCWYASGLVVAALGWSAGAHAQESTERPESGISEIVVTAQRRAENMQKVPVSITALDAKAITERGFSDTIAITKDVPNLEVKTFVGNPNFFIRGVGLNDFNSSSISPVSIYRDDVVVAASGAQIFSLFDLDRVEVLRGPQGTLFGKNTTGGSLQFFSHLPGNDVEGYARIGYGRFNRVETEGGVTVPLSNTLSARVSGIFQRDDGPRINAFNNTRSGEMKQYAGRIILRWRPQDGTEVRLESGVGRDRSDMVVAKPLGVINGANAFGYSDPYPNDSRTLNYNYPTQRHSNDFFTNLTIMHEMGDFSIKLIGGYDDNSVANNIDVDGSPTKIDELQFRSTGKQYTGEFQLGYDNGPLKAIFGLYYFKEKFQAHNDVNIFGELTSAQGALPVVTDSRRDNDAYAAFLQGTYEVLPGLRLTAGGRYTIDKVNVASQVLLIPGYFNTAEPLGTPIPLVPFAKLGDTFRSFSWRLSADYDVSANTLAYASINRGFKAGGYNIGVIFSAAERTEVEPEFLTAYEIGLKTTLFDRRLRMNLAAFHYKYSNMQVQSVQTVPGQSVPALAIENAAEASIDGIEAEVTALPTNWLTLGASAGYLDAKFKSYASAGLDPSGNPLDFSGNKLPGAPEWTLGLNAEVKVPLDGDMQVRLRGSYNYTSQIYFNNAQDEVISSGKSRSIADVRLTLEDTAAGWSLAAFGKNIFNETYIVDAIDLRGLSIVPRFYGDPARWGVELSYRF